MTKPKLDLTVNNKVKKASFVFVNFVNQQLT